MFILFINNYHLYKHNLNFQANLVSSTLQRQLTVVEANQRKSRAARMWRYSRLWSRYREDKLRRLEISRTGTTNRMRSKKFENVIACKQSFHNFKNFLMFLWMLNFKHLFVFSEHVIQQTMSVIWLTWWNLCTKG